MNCQEVMEYMQRQLDQDLDEGELLLLQNHIKQCADCAAMFERLKLLSSELSSLPKVMPGYSLVDAILPKLDQIDKMKESDSADYKDAAGSVNETGVPRRKARKRIWPSFRIASGVVAAGVVAGLFILLYNPAQDKANNMALMDNFKQRGENHSAASTSSADAPASNAAGGQEPEVTTEGIGQRSISEEAHQYSTSSKSDGQGAGNAAGEPAQESANTPDPDIKELGIVMSNEDTAKEKVPEVEELDTALVGQSKDTSMLSVPSISELSPDGQYNAVAEGYIITIYNTEDNSIIWETARKNGKLTDLTWSEDGTELTYEVHIDSGAQEKYALHMDTGLDQKRSY